MASKLISLRTQLSGVYFVAVVFLYLFSYKLLSFDHGHRDLEHGANMENIPNKMHCKIRVAKPNLNRTG